MSLRQLILMSCAFLSLGASTLCSQALLPDERHTLVTPVALVRGFQDAQIAIANRDAFAVAAKLTLRDESGIAVATAPVPLVPHDLQTISFSSVLNGMSIDNVRSVSVEYQGRFRTLASQVTLLKFKNGASADATLYEDREFSSSQLNAV